MSTLRYGNCAQLETKKLHSNGMYSLEFIFEGKAIFTLTGTRASVDKVRDMVAAAHWAGYVGVQMNIKDAENIEERKNVCAVPPIKTAET